jgi:DNA polymerase-4
MDRCILHFDLDTFFVSVERLQNKKLIGKPVIIGGTSDRGVVASCSYEARQFGVHSAMPMKMALNLCNEAIVIRGDSDQYTKYSNIVTEIITEKAPMYEKTSIDEHYIDMTGMDKFFGCEKWAHELRQRIIKNTGLPISCGLSLNKTVSKIATGEAKPNGELLVPKEKIKTFLFPLSIRKIPGVGAKNYQILRTMGISTIRTLSAIPVEMMEKVLGKNGVQIWKKANGIDFTPVKPYSERKSISTERTFETDTTDIAMLNDKLISMVEKLSFTLRKKEKVTSCISVKIRYSNFDTHTLQKRISYTAFDHVLINTAKELFKKLYNRRLLIRLIGVKFSHLVHGATQLNLFEDTAEMVKLYMALDKLKKRYGSKIVRRAVGIKRKKDEGSLQLTVGNRQPTVGNQQSVVKSLLASNYQF